jgi:hypothetical protein
MSKDAKWCNGRREKSTVLGQYRISDVLVGEITCVVMALSTSSAHAFASSGQLSRFDPLRQFGASHGCSLRPLNNSYTARASIPSIRFAARLLIEPAFQAPTIP